MSACGQNMAKLKHRSTAAGRRGSGEQQAQPQQTNSRRTTDEEQDDQDSTAAAPEVVNDGLDWRSRPVSRETNDKLKKLVGLMLVVLMVVSATAGYISYTKGK